MNGEVWVLDASAFVKIMQGLSEAEAYLDGERRGFVATRSWSPNRTTPNQKPRRPTEARPMLHKSHPDEHARRQTRTRSVDAPVVAPFVQRADDDGAGTHASVTAPHTHN